MFQCRPKVAFEFGPSIYIYFFFASSSIHHPNLIAIATMKESWKMTGKVSPRIKIDEEYEMKHTKQRDRE